jgi:hypothetical protein
MVMLATLFASSEEAAHLSDGGVLAQWAWLIPVVPLVLMFAIVFFGKRLPAKGWELAEAAMLFVAVYGVVLLVMNASAGIYHEGSIEIARIGSYTLEWGWVVDGLSIMMYAVIGVWAWQCSHKGLHERRRPLHLALRPRNLPGDAGIGLWHEPH